MDLLLAVLFQLLLQVPTFVVWVVGIVLAVSRRDEHPRGYTLAAIAFGIFLVLAIISTATNTIVPLRVIQNGGNASQAGVVMGALNLAYTVVQLVAWIFILVALFRRREPVADPGQRF